MSQCSDGSVRPEGHSAWGWDQIGVGLCQQSHPHLVKSRLAYLALIVSKARRNGGNGWITYDAIFRQIATEDEAVDWTRLDTSLHAATFIAQSSNARSVCIHCSSSDHLPRECALPPLSSTAGYATQSHSGSQPRSPHRTTRDQGLYLSHSRSALGGTRVTVPPPFAATAILAQLALAIIEPAIARRLRTAPFTSGMPLRPDTTVRALTRCPVFGRTFGCYYCCILMFCIFILSLRSFAAVALLL